MPVCDDEKSPSLYHVYSSHLPPEAAYRIEPLKKDLASIDLKSSKKKGMRRWIFEGWNNWTDFEKQQIQIVKDTMKSEHNIDFDTVKNFGPRPAATGPYVAGNQQVVNGRDYWFGDHYILRFLVARYFDIKRVVKELRAHLEWR